jgi:hypothetical protein
MYPFFSNLKIKPIVILMSLVVVMILLFSISSTISSLGTFFGFDTKENTAIRLEKTNTELGKATELLENNEKTDLAESEVDKIAKEKALQDAITVDKIKDEETKVLETIKNTVVVDEDIKSDKPDVNNIKAKPTVVYVKKKLNNKQKLAISLLRDRARLLKGSKL